MRYLKLSGIIILLAVASTYLFGQTTVIPAETMIKEALAKATKTNRNVFIIFHASWCVWCHKMDNSMNDEKLKSFFDKNYVIVHLTVDESKDKKYLENPGAEELLKKYKGEHLGIPYWFILDANGKLLADSRLPRGTDVNSKTVSVGCPASDEEVNYFINVLKKTSSLNDEQLASIEKRFLKNSE